MLGYGAIGQFTIGQVGFDIGSISQPWTEPPSPKTTKAIAVALIASGLFAPVFIKDEAKLQSRWYQQWRDPVRTLPNIGPHKVPAYTGPFFIKDEAKLQSRWYQPLSEPQRFLPGPRAASQQSLAFYPFPVPTVTINISWFNNLSEPTRRVKSTPTDQQFFPYSPIIPSYGWYASLTDPTRRIRPTPTDQQFTQYSPIIPSLGWYGWLSDPVRKLRIASFDPQNFVFQVTPAVVSFGWFGGLNEPVRNKPRVAWTDHISFQFPFIPSFGWFNKFDDFTRSRRPISWSQAFSFSPSPIIPSYGWYGRLTDPVRIKPRALQQIFSAVPESTPAFFYLAALNTTEQRDFFFAVLYQFNPPLRAYVDIIEKDPGHRGNLGIIEPAAEPSIIASIVPQSASATGGTPVPTVAGARVAIIT